MKPAKQVVDALEGNRKFDNESSRRRDLKTGQGRTRSLKQKTGR